MTTYNPKMLAPSPKPAAIVEPMPHPILDRGVAPPPDYYRGNLLRVIDYVASIHGDLLDTSDAQFIASVQSVSALSQRLYARLISRKGPWIRQDKLAYREVDDLDTALLELTANDLLELSPEAPAEGLLPLYLKAELAELFALQTPRKDALVMAILSRYPDALIRERLSSVSPWLAVTHRRSLRLAQLLFFGDGHRDLSAFILEDLGMVRYETYQVAPEQRLFENREALARYQRLRKLRDLAHRVGEHPAIAPVLAERMIAEGIGAEGIGADAINGGSHNRLEQRLHQRTLNHLGRWFERWHSIGAALDCYGWAHKHPARERSVRLLTKLGDTRGSNALLDEIRANPATPEEQDFGERFGRRGAGVKPPTTICELDGSVVDDIEAHAIRHLQLEGGEGWHLENRLPLGLTALAFWDVIFAPVDGAFLNPYQTGPVDLYWQDFARIRGREIEAQTARLSEPRGFAAALQTTWQTKFGVANQLMSWRHIDDYLLQRVLETIPHAQLLRLVCHVIHNLPSRRTGFPDLLILYGTSTYEFVEVKGPTDQLQPTQRMWFKYLLDHQYPARVLKFRA